MPIQRVAGRRRFMVAGATAMLPLEAAPAARQAGKGRNAANPVVAPAARRWSLPPVQAPSKPFKIDVGNGVRLSGWDTGGRGDPVVLLHPATGSAAIWGYQQPVLAEADYRVIAYSRRGHGESDPGPEGDKTPAIEDLAALLAVLGVDRFHAVSSAAGGFLVPDFALSYPGRMISMVLSCTQGGVTDADYRRRIARCTPSPFFQMPESFRELGPSYRAACEQGVEAWEALEHAAIPGRRVPLLLKNQLPWSAIGAIETPALIIGGAADLYMPASLSLEYASRLKNAEAAILSECGHSGYWEQPDAFNALILSFLAHYRIR